MIEGLLALDAFVILPQELRIEVLVLGHIENIR